MTSPREPVGLRERKKAKTRAAIRDHAMRLFAAQGYAETTVDQIADAAEVSPSTFFRYFPTKEDVVLQDDAQPMLVAAISTQPAHLSPIRAVRAAIRAVHEGMPADLVTREAERHALIKSVPELRTAVLDQYAESLRSLSRVIAARLGRGADDFEVRVFAGALIGVVLAAVETGGFDVELLDAALGLLEAGLPL
ncbi:MAG TPA: TetR family transcriptional regulator [Pseudonocardiaceae bacterium]|nr:TetR family transcriptional regulator [Pseudonocardiaceae bacterium]